jgi:Flp pilus assembly protein TadB
MAKTDDDAYEELRKRYVEKLRSTLGEEQSQELHTRQYEEFRKEYMPKPLSWYEKACNGAARILPLSPDAKRRPQLAKAIATCHLQTTPEGITAFSVVAPLLLILATVGLFLLLPMALGNSGSLFVTLYVAIAALVLIIPLGRIPLIIADTWRMRASNQMVLCIFYVVTYMRHTSNLELAIDFAAEHLAPPLSLDMKKIMWEIETQRYDSLKDSMEAYLEAWRGTNDEFIDAIHLVESSLVEASEQRRLEALDKALSVMLEETYEKMLHYAHNLQSPITTLHMLGIILPILGLVILPLLVSFMPEVRWYHLFLLYNVTLPLVVYFLGRDLLSKRPTGYGGAEVEASARDVNVGGFSLTPLFVAGFVFAALLLIGLLPLLVHAANPSFDLVYTGKGETKGCILGFCAINTADKEQTKEAKFWLLEYREVQVDQETQETIVVGPFGLVATLLSLFLPLALGLSLGIYYKLRSRDVMRRRDEAKKLELEFASALFQLGNRLADGLPLEIAFSKVAAVLPDTVAGRFFSQVSANITKLGLSVEEAIFDERHGALVEYPSNIIESSMKVLVESSRKGPLIASQAIINVSNYIKEMHRVDERLKDLMADVISSMTSQIKFLTPTIAGIVMGITSMITAILGKLGAKVGELQAQTAGQGAGAAGIGSSLLSTFSGGAVGTYFFQLVVGLYVVQIIFVLTILVNGIENGPDKTSERAMLGKNMVNSTLTYVALSFVVILLFNIVATNIVPG